LETRNATSKARKDDARYLQGTARRNGVDRENRATQTSRSTRRCRAVPAISSRNQNRSIRASVQVRIYRSKMVSGLASASRSSHSPEHAGAAKMVSRRASAQRTSKSTFRHLYSRLVSSFSSYSRVVSPLKIVADDESAGDVEVCRENCEGGSRQVEDCRFHGRFDSKLDGGDQDTAHISWSSCAKARRSSSRNANSSEAKRAPRSRGSYAANVAETISAREEKKSAASLDGNRRVPVYELAHSFVVAYASIGCDLYSAPRPRFSRAVVRASQALSDRKNAGERTHCEMAVKIREEASTYRQAAVDGSHVPYSSFASKVQACRSHYFEVLHPQSTLSQALEGVVREGVRRDKE